MSAQPVTIPCSSQAACDFDPGMLYCDLSIMQCTQRLSRGQPCTEDAQCVTPLVCTSSPLAYGKNGSSTTATSTIKNENAACDDPSSIICNYTADCPSGYFCSSASNSTTLTCTNQLFEGASCSSNDMCRSGTCTTNHLCSPSPSSPTSNAPLPLIVCAALVVLLLSVVTLVSGKQILAYIMDQFSRLRGSNNQSNNRNTNNNCPSGDQLARRHDRHHPLVSSLSSISSDTGNQADAFPGLANLSTAEEAALEAVVQKPEIDDDLISYGEAVRLSMSSSRGSHSSVASAASSASSATSPIDSISRSSLSGAWLAQQQQFDDNGQSPSGMGMLQSPFPLSEMAESEPPPPPFEAIDLDSVSDTAAGVGSINGSNFLSRPRSMETIFRDPSAPPPYTEESDEVAAINMMRRCSTLSLDTEALDALEATFPFNQGSSSSMSMLPRLSRPSLH